MTGAEAPRRADVPYSGGTVPDSHRTSPSSEADDSTRDVACSPYVPAPPPSSYRRPASRGLVRPSSRRPGGVARWCGRWQRGRRRGSGGRGPDGDPARRLRPRRRPALHYPQRRRHDDGDQRRRQGTGGPPAATADRWRAGGSSPGLRARRLRPDRGGRHAEPCRGARPGARAGAGRRTHDARDGISAAGVRRAPLAWRCRRLAVGQGPRQGCRHDREAAGDGSHAAGHHRWRCRRVLPRSHRRGDRPRHGARGRHHVARGSRRARERDPTARRHRLPRRDGARPTAVVAGDAAHDGVAAPQCRAGLRRLAGRASPRGRGHDGRLRVPRSHHPRRRRCRADGAGRFDPDCRARKSRRPR